MVSFLGYGDSSAKKEICSVDTAELLDGLVRFLGYGSNDAGESSAKLGGLVRFLGYGSKAGESSAKTEICQVIRDCDAKHVKAMRLSHFYYRTFLEYIHTTFLEEAVCRVGKKRFQERYDQLRMETDTGAHKSADRNTPKTCASSILAADFCALIVELVERSTHAPKWASEYTLEEGPKQTRCDGLLLMSDPIVEESLRPLVVMEAKQSDFKDEDELQSRSNAVDAFSLKPKGDSPWPLLVFRRTMNRDECSIEVEGVVPTSETKMAVVPMWSGDGPDALYNAVACAAKAAEDYRAALLKQKRQLPFCHVLRNVAIEVGGRAPNVYKSFQRPTTRRANLELLQAFVDPEAKEVKLVLLSK